MDREVAIGGVALGPRPRIVAAGGEAEMEALGRAEGADLVEVRADLFADPEPAALAAILRRLRAVGRPVIFTVRAAAEGGRALDEKRRAALYDAALPYVDAVDAEIVSTALTLDLVPAARAAGRTVILSAHALEATPPADGLISLVDRGFGLGADVVKLATHASTLEDLQTLIAVTTAARRRGIVTLAMGPFGPLSRVVLPAAGSLLTYGHVGEPTAPGQLPVRELAALLGRLYPDDAAGTS
jgi:3-dehydroquinate dehydratase-1